jgi:hypothetical protein
MTAVADASDHGNTLPASFNLRDAAVMNCDLVGDSASVS